MNQQFNLPGPRELGTEYQTRKDSQDRHCRTGEVIGILSRGVSVIVLGVLLERQNTQQKVWGARSEGASIIVF